MPVNPADFLCKLDAFRKALPTINSLRLCNRFGKGENTGITKLPRELIGFIEEELLELHREHEENRLYGWSKTYCCFEGSCRPSDHLDGGDLDMYEDVIESAEIDLLKAHPEWSTADGLDFPADYQDLLDEEVANRLDEYADEYMWEFCFQTKMEWEAKTRKHMTNNGNDDVCTLLGNCRVCN